ncbi:MAG: putative metalloprotease CJM1_0395 family protein [Planctomycetota bacterium]
MSTLSNALFDRAAHSAPPPLADTSRRLATGSAAASGGAAIRPSATSAAVGAAPADTVELSEQALRGTNRPEDAGVRRENAAAPGGGAAEETGANAPVGRDGEPLDDAEQKQVEELKARDREVRQHEQAHKAAAGPYATSGPTYSYQEGPDGKRYAVGGSVGIDTSPEATPEETIAKMQVVRRAALAPAEPSSQDRKVAAQASQTIQQARAELAQQQQDELSGVAVKGLKGTSETNTDAEPTAAVIDVFA